MPDFKKVINCAGKMTYLGSSVLSDAVIDEMSLAAKNFYFMSDLEQILSENIAHYANAEASYITAGASSGIIASVAGLVTQGNQKLVEDVPCVGVSKKEIILQKGHAIDFGAQITQMIKLGGGLPVEVGTINKTLDYQLENTINENTAGILYVVSHHAQQDGMLDINTVISMAKKHNVPIIIDAAAEEDFKKYIDLGADLVVYSGAKAFNGPTSGCIVGSKEKISWCKAQSRGVMRAIKVGKETMFGLHKAVQLHAEDSDIKAKQIALLSPLKEYFDSVEGLSTEFKSDVTGRDITRLKLNVSSEYVMDAVELSETLKTSDPAVYTRAHHAEAGYIEFDPRPMQESDAKLIIEVFERLVK